MDIPEEIFPVMDPELRFEARKVNLNPYLFGGRYAGSFVRLSTNSVINVSVGGGMAPAFVVPDSLVTATSQRRMSSRGDAPRSPMRGKCRWRY